MNNRSIVLSVLSLWVVSLACNLPNNAPTQAPASEASDVEPTFTSTPSEAPSGESESACAPTVTTTTIANVRNGPGQIYAVIGSIPLGGTAPVAGKSADSAWWYIEFAAGEGGHAWIAGIVTTASCIPETLAIIAAPPAPVVAATNAPTSSSGPASESSDPPESSEGAMPTPTLQFIPLLIPIYPTLLIDIRMDNIKDLGNYLVLYIFVDAPDGITGSYEYKVWVYDSLVITTTIPLTDGLWTYTLPGYDPPSGTFSARAKVDTTNVIAEYDETNNDITVTCPDADGVFCY